MTAQRREIIRHDPRRASKRLVRHCVDNHSRNKVKATERTTKASMTASIVKYNTRNLPPTTLNTNRILLRQYILTYHNLCGSPTKHTPKIVTNHDRPFIFVHLAGHNSLAVFPVSIHAGNKANECPPHPAPWYIHTRVADEKTAKFGETIAHSPIPVR